jgi:hypothetical protein
MVRILADGACGGATVGFVTDVVIDEGSSVFRRRAVLLTLKGKEPVEATWLSSTHLQVCYRMGRSKVIGTAKPRWKNITVSYADIQSVTCTKGEARVNLDE